MGQFSLVPRPLTRFRFMFILATGQFIVINMYKVKGQTKGKGEKQNKNENKNTAQHYTHTHTHTQAHMRSTLTHIIFLPQKATWTPKLNSSSWFISPGEQPKTCPRTSKFAARSCPTWLTSSPIWMETQMRWQRTSSTAETHSSNFSPTSCELLGLLCKFSFAQKRTTPCICTLCSCVQTKWFFMKFWGRSLLLAYLRVVWQERRKFM